jgi:ubiquitin-protein ligase E3 C
VIYQSTLQVTYADNSRNSTLSSADELDGISLLSGYLLVLLRCFPNEGDEIRMRLYLGDVPSGKNGQIPTLRFLWDAVSSSSIFRSVVTDDNAPIKLLKSYFSSPEGLDEPSGNNFHDGEWRIILLFLELYSFILRLSDDEDFFSVIRPSLLKQEASLTRIQRSSLSLRHVESLTWFLKNLAFTLHHDTTQITGSLATARKTNSKHGIINQVFKASPANGTRLDFDSTKAIITTTMRMLYERDSRRPFLPAGHWLMTSRFDMRGFITDVVVEQQRQQDVSNDSESEEEEDTAGDHDLWALPHTAQGQRLSHHARIERLQNRQRKVQRERFLASIGPKLEILRHMPFVIPFETRVQIFRQFVYLDKMKRREGHVDPDQWRLSIRNSTGFDQLHTHQATIRRGRVFAVSLVL